MEKDSNPRTYSPAEEHLVSQKLVGSSSEKKTNIVSGKQTEISTGKKSGS